MAAQSAIPHFLLSWKQESVVDYTLMDIWVVRYSRRIKAALLRSTMMMHTHAVSVSTKSVRYGAG
jgi:hypothetical protein